MCAKLHTVAPSNNGYCVTWRHHCIIACSCHVYMGVILRAHPVHGELHIQCNANREVATETSYTVVRTISTFARIILLVESYKTINKSISFLCRTGNQSSFQLGTKFHYTPKRNILPWFFRQNLAWTSAANNQFLKM